MLTGADGCNSIAPVSLLIDLLFIFMKYYLMKVDVVHLTEESPCNTNNKSIDSILPQILFDTFLSEAATMLSNEDLSSLSLPHSSPFVFSARIFSNKHPYVDFLMCGRENPPAGLHVLTREGASNNSSGLLRNFVGPALGLTNTSRMHSIFFDFYYYFNIFDQLQYFCTTQKFALTTDFAAKLLMVHERLKASQSIIISGDMVLVVLYPIIEWLLIFITGHREDGDVKYVLYHC